MRGKNRTLYWTTTETTHNPLIFVEKNQLIANCELQLLLVRGKNRTLYRTITETTHNPLIFVEKNQLIANCELQLLLFFQKVGSPSTEC